MKITLTTAERPKQRGRRNHGDEYYDDADEENETVGEMTVATKTVMITLNFTLNVN